MGAIRNFIAGKLRSSSTVKELMNLPEDPWGLLERVQLQANNHPGVFTADPAQWAVQGSGGIQRLAQRLPGHGAGHSTILYLYHVIREALPICNNAIQARRYLEGTPVVTSQDEGLQTAIRDFMRNLPVGNHAREAQAFRGVETAVNLLKDHADEYGLALMEPVLNAAGTDIERVILPNPRTLQYKKNRETGEWGLYHTPPGEVEREITNPNIILFTFTYSGEEPWPPPLYWGLPFTAEVLMRMIVSMNNLWWRSGDPAQIYSILYDKEYATTNRAQIAKDIKALQETVEGIHLLKRGGRVTDGYLGLQANDIKQTTVGANPLSESLARFFREHYTTIGGQVIARAGVPVWMFPDIELAGEGLNSNRSDHQDGVSMGYALKRNIRAIEALKKLIDTWLIVTGNARQLGRYEVDFEYANIRDEKIFEDTRGSRENANQTAIENAQRLVDLGISEEDDREQYLARAGVIPES